MSLKIKNSVKIILLNDENEMLLMCAHETSDSANKKEYTKYWFPIGGTIEEGESVIEAAIRKMNVPGKFAFQVTIFSEAPAGASTGTSAAVTVALIGALDCLTPGRMTPHEVAVVAHSVETEILKQP